MARRILCRWRVRNEVSLYLLEVNWWTYIPDTYSRICLSLIWAMSTDEISEL